MGKKGVILDNGKSAKSSMALYWKANKQRSKLPKQKVDHQEKDDQITDQRVMSNFQKWKTHKQKIISKAYTKPQPKINNQKQAQQKQEEYQQKMQQILQRKKPSSIKNVPGFKSKQNLANKLQMQKAKQADQSTNILRLPSHMGALSHEQIVQMLRQKKSKQQLENKYRKQNNQKFQRQDVLLGQDFQNFLKKKQKEQNQQQKQKQKVEVKEQLPVAYFKSDILNKIQKQGISKGLQTVIPKNNILKSQINQTTIQNSNHVVKDQIQIIQQPQWNNLAQKILQKKQIQQFKPQFLPRVLKK